MEFLLDLWNKWIDIMERYGLKRVQNNNTMAILFYKITYLPNREAASKIINTKAV